MPTHVIMPVLGVSQDFGKILHWFKSEGQMVVKGEPLFEVETDKTVVEIESPASGILSSIKAAEGTDVPVTDVVAIILGVGEKEIFTSAPASVVKRETLVEHLPSSSPGQNPSPLQPNTVQISPLAARIAAESQVDLTLIRPKGARIEKADVLEYLEKQKSVVVDGRLLASPKARRLAVELGLDLSGLKGSGPDGAVLAGDVPMEKPGVLVPAAVTPGESIEMQPLSTIWRIMAERTTQSWTHVPHFFLLREVNTTRLMSWRERLMSHSTEKITYTDLLVRVVAAALRRNPAVNATWQNGTVVRKNAIHIGLAAALEEGLVVPVIHNADQLSLEQIARARVDLVQRAHSGKLRPQDIEDGTFTISNLGMYGVDAFSAIINAPQAAILAVGRILERVVPVKGQPSVQPMMTLSLSCDHRVLDGARGAKFLETIADLIEEPAGLIQ